MKFLRIALAWLLLSGPVFAQAQLGAGQVWGNSTAAKAPGRSENVTAILDRALGSAQGSVIERGASGWGLIGPGTAGLPFVSAGAGADPLYQVVGVIGGGTGINLYAIGDIVCAIGTTTLSRTADIATGNVLLAGGVGACPTYGKVTSAHITGAALTKTDDTNVTLTLGGTPASALVNAASLTLGWTGQLSIARGGTGQTTQQAAFDALGPTATRAGDIVYWNGTHYVTLAGNNSGTNVLSENASGVPSWAAPGAGTVQSVTCGATVITGTGTCPTIAVVKTASPLFFTGSGTYTPSTGLVYAVVECVGGGGGGGGTGSIGGQGGAGASGGSGAYSRISLSAAAIGASKAVTIGAAGGGGGAGPNSGANGGDTSLGTLCLAKGGALGCGTTTPNSCGLGGAGGLASGGTGDVKTNGNGGSPGSGNAIATVNPVSGPGPGSLFGGGAPGSTGAGSAATGCGGAGSGGATSGAANIAGGAGFAGCVVITEFTNQ
jgi:hypothetical protein